MKETVLIEEINLYMPPWKRIVAVLLPAVLLSGLLGASLPMSWHPAREVAGYFQALALIRTGIGSYFYLTPEENLSGLHLHSILSAPLLKLGYLEAGRLVSLTAAVGAAATVSLIGKDIVGNRAAFFAPIFLWLHPLFIRFSHAWTPETLSIALTTFAVYSMIRFVDYEDRKFYILGLITLSLAITNHLWEAIIALPMVVILLYERNWIHAAGVSVITAGTVGVVRFVTSLQPAPSSLLWYSIFDTGVDIFFRPGWWSHHLSSVNPVFALAITATLPLTISLTVWFAYLSFRTHSRTALILTSWFLAGLVIIFSLPRGFYYHSYYLWGLLSPLALAGTVGLRYLLEQLPKETERTFASAASISLLAIISIYIMVGAFGIGGFIIPMNDDHNNVNEESLHDAGKTIRSSTIPTENITFIGWNVKHYRDNAVTKVMIYSGRVLKHRAPTERGGVKVINRDTTSQCGLLVYNQSHTVEVVNKSCP